MRNILLLFTTTFFLAVLLFGTTSPAQAEEVCRSKSNSTSPSSGTYLPFSVSELINGQTLTYSTSAFAQISYAKMDGIDWNNMGLIVIGSNLSGSTTINIPAGTTHISVSGLDVGDFNLCTEILKSVVSDVTGGTDPDDDGISGSRDNCPYDFNPDQEDGWGSAMGDACDTEWYNLSGQGIAGFVQKDGMFNLHGNCAILDDGATRCPVIASFDPTTFDPASTPLEITSEDAGTWSTWLYYLHSNNGAAVYQVNVYSTNPPQPDTLIDDRMEIHVDGDTWQWYQRGGDTQYHGN